ncbi:MAG: hypothetical protein IKK08_03495 [Clostridia bacterium]|jgi:hypothetical protein|nr:hypothetical protein [Clostridia bacterium]
MEMQQNLQWLLERMNTKEFRALSDRLEQIVSSFLTYDLHFMRVTGVLDENDELGENEYDEDEAFEFIYDAFLSDHPNESDDDMVIASLLNRYMELQAEYL